MDPTTTTSTTMDDGTLFTMAIALGAVLGTLLTLCIVTIFLYFGAPALVFAWDCRRRLPKTIILVRHGESEANVDRTVWQRIPDSMVSLTAKGRGQAKDVGQRIERLLEGCHKCRRVHLVVSPFERTLQTAMCMREAFEHRIQRTVIESRVREQEMGNMQGKDFSDFRKEQKKVGRFWYRFPTGESGSDVCDRVKSWWFDSVLTVNQRYKYDNVDALVVVTHGLTIRFILTAVYNWSPTTFHSMWNADNCAMFVLQRDLAKPGPSPYVIDKVHGDEPKSSVEVMVKLHACQSTKTLHLENWLDIPTPRVQQTEIIKKMLHQQHPDFVKHPDNIDSLVVLPFIEGEEVAGRTISI